MRRMFGAAVVTAILWAAAAEAGPASDVVQGLNGQFLSTMQNAETLGYEGRYQALAPALTGAYDFAEMARVSAGRYWRDLTEAQRTELVETFAAYSTATYAARFDGFSGEKFQVLGEQPAPTDAVRVNSHIEPGGGDPIRIDYLLRQKDGKWRIVDVYLQSSVSELALRRSTFSGLLAKDGYDGLIAWLRAEIDKLKSGAD